MREGDASRDRFISLRTPTGASNEDVEQHAPLASRAHTSAAQRPVRAAAKAHGCTATDRHAAPGDRQKSNVVTLFKIITRDR